MKESADLSGCHVIRYEYKSVLSYFKTKQYSTIMINGFIQRKHKHKFELNLHKISIQKYVFINVGCFISFGCEN